MKYFRFSMPLVILLLSFPVSALAGPWTKAPGEAYVKLSQMYFSSNTYIDANGVAVQGTDYAAATTALYAEVGVLPNVHVQAFVPYLLSRNYFESEKASYANVGFGDANLAVQWTPVKTKIPWALKLETKIPMYDLAAVSGSRANSFPALGAGQVDATLWASVGASFYPLPIYALAEVGYQYRTALYLGEDNGARYLNAVPFNAQIGASLLDIFFVSINMGGNIALGDDLLSPSFATAGLAAGAKIWKTLALEATASFMIYSKNNSPGESYSLGLSYQL